MKPTGKDLGPRAQHETTTPKAMKYEPRFFWIYLGALALLGAGVVYTATSAMGPGVSTDSAKIMSTAENLVRGRGLVEFNGQPLTQFPPLYSMILALGSGLFQADVFDVGWHFNAWVFAALIWFTGVQLRRGFEDEPILAYLGSFVVFASRSLIEISSNIASDPFFLLIVIGFLMAAGMYLRRGDQGSLAALAAITLISCFHRYAGLSLVFTGSLIVAYQHRRQLIRALGMALAFAVITGGPILAWGLLHNAPVNGTVFGARLPPSATGNLVAGAEKVLYWFFPYRVIAAVGPLNLLVASLFALGIAVAVIGGRVFLEDLRRPEVAPHVAFLLVYAAVLVFNISYYELKGLKTDRVHIIMLPSLLMIIAVVGHRLLQALRRRVQSRLVYAAFLVAFLFWSAYPISKSYEYVRESMIHGDVSSYNSINKSHVRESQLAAFLQGPELQAKAVYTNGGDTVWFITRGEVLSLPLLRTEDREAELLRNFNHWPGIGIQAYIVWINAEAHKTNYATPDELRTIADLVETYRDGSAAVFRVTGH